VFHRVLDILVAVWHILAAVWRAYVRRVRAAEGQRQMAWIIAPIVGLLLLFGMLMPTAPAAPTSALQELPPTRTSAPTRTPRPERTRSPRPTALPEPTATVEVPAAAQTEVPVVDAPAAAPAEVPAVEVPVSQPGDESYPCAPGQLKGNRDSKIFHSPGGASYAKTQADVRCFATSADAEAAGYRAAKR